MKVIDFINGKVEYDKNGGQYFWIKDPKRGSQMLAEMRGWGAIQNLFIAGIKSHESLKNGTYLHEAGKFQDMIGDFIAEAINEKIEREKSLLKS